MCVTRSLFAVRSPRFARGPALLAFRFSPETTQRSSLCAGYTLRPHLTVCHPERSVRAFAFPPLLLRRADAQSKDLRFARSQ